MRTNDGGPGSYHSFARCTLSNRYPLPIAALRLSLWIESASISNMDALREIIQFLDQENHLHPTDVWLQAEKTEEYALALLRGDFRDEDEAARHFYGTDRSNTAYQKLKSKLRKALMQRLLTLDFQNKNHTNRQRAYNRCNRDWAALKVLWGRSNRKGAVQLTKRLLRQTQHYEFTDLTVDICRHLRLHYSVVERNKQQFTKYSDLFEESARVLAWEDQAEASYAEIASLFYSPKTRMEDVNRAAGEAYRQIEPALQQNDSHRLLLSGSLIHLIHLSSENRYHEVIEACKQTLSRWDNKPYATSKPYQLVQHYLLQAYTKIQEYDEASAAAQNRGVDFQAGSINWYLHNEQLFLLYMHTARYQEALEVYQEVSSHSSFRESKTSIREVWMVFEAYLSFLYKVGLLETDNEILRDFKLRRFINDTLYLSQQKHRMNIPILVIQLLFLIVDKQYREVTDKIDAIKKYCDRYVKRRDAVRSNSFIKMLLELPNARYHRAAVERKTERYLQRLQGEPIRESQQQLTVEVMPYEQVWPVVLKQLGNTFHR